MDTLNIKTEALNTVFLALVYMGALSALAWSAAIIMTYSIQSFQFTLHY